MTPPSRNDARITGTWFIDRDKSRFSLDVAVDEKAQRLTGRLVNEKSPDLMLAVDGITWNAEKSELRFHAPDAAGASWYIVQISDGVMSGRYALAAEDGPAPTSWAAYSGHVTGWRSESFDADIVPRTFDIVIAGEQLAKVRIDRAADDPAAFIGELKVYASRTHEGGDEIPAADIAVSAWDGVHLAFALPSDSGRRLFNGTVTGRTIGGSVVTDDSTPPASFEGVRADLFAYGLSAKTPAERAEWQRHTRERMFRLMMAGNPSPLGREVTAKAAAPLTSDNLPIDRDDDAAGWAQDYRVTELWLAHTLPNPYGGEALRRESHGVLAVPMTPPPAGGYGLVLAVNGHGGSAWRHFRPDDSFFWYGDAFARRGYVVLALDISHRPPKDTGGLYDDVTDGDDPDMGNHAHPAIAAPGMDSDWTEDGERAWDAMRGIDYLVSLPNGNPSKLIVTGLSMGGEVTEIVGALDPRVTVVVPAGAPPDYSLMEHHNNHYCWPWLHGQATEYIDAADYLAMAAPRPVILQTGLEDATYSSYTKPSAIEKENARRARVAFGDQADQFVHYLHYDWHHYHVGDASILFPQPSELQEPRFADPGEGDEPFVDWASDDETISLGRTLFEQLNLVLGG